MFGEEQQIRGEEKRISGGGVKGESRTGGRDADGWRRGDAVVWMRAGVKCRGGVGR